MKSNSQHYAYIDLLRFLAAFTVVAAHARAVTFLEYGALLEEDQNPYVGIFFALTRLGNEAVIFFFVLSGFLVGGKVLERVYKGNFSAIDYGIDRLTRIMLPLIPALCFTAIINFFITGEFNIAVFIGNLLSLQGIVVPNFGSNGPLWSLAYEVWFYVLALLVGLAFTRKNGYTLIFCAIAFVLGLFTVLKAVYLFAWIIGALAYFMLPKTPSIKLAISALLLSAYALLCHQFGKQSDSISQGLLANILVMKDSAVLLMSLGFSVLIRQISLAPLDNRFWVFWRT